MIAMASRSWGQLTTGAPAFTMPAFSPAMAATVSPSKSVWSSPMRQITLASGRVDDVGGVESPPEAHFQHDDIAAHGPEMLEGHRRHELELRGMIPRVRLHGLGRRAHRLPPPGPAPQPRMFSPFTRMRSSKQRMNGLVNRPTL